MENYLKKSLKENGYYTLKKVEEAELLKRAKDRQISKKEREEAKEDLIKCAKGLVINEAKKYNGYPYLNLEFSDLIQEGYIGLIEAIEKFDYKRGCKFSTYATWWIRRFILRALGRYSIIKIPVSFQEEKECFQVGKVRRAEKKIRQTGKEPTIKELAKETGMPGSIVKRIKNLYYQTVSLEAPLKNRGYDKRTLADIISSNKESPAEYTTKILLREKLENILSSKELKLRKKEKEIIYLRFGLERDGQKERKKQKGPMTLAEIGKKYGVSRQEIYHLEEKVLEKIILSREFEGLGRLGGYTQETIKKVQEGTLRKMKEKKKKHI